MLSPARIQTSLLRSAVYVFNSIKLLQYFSKVQTQYRLIINDIRRSLTAFSLYRLRQDSIAGSQAFSSRVDSHKSKQSQTEG